MLFTSKGWIYRNRGRVHKLSIIVDESIKHCSTFYHGKVSTMSLNIANNFYERSRESENALKKVYTRITENEYVTLKLDNKFSSEKNLMIFSLHKFQ